MTTVSLVRPRRAANGQAAPRRQPARFRTSLALALLTALAGAAALLAEGPVSYGGRVLAVAARSADGVVLGNDGRWHVRPRTGAPPGSLRADRVLARPQRLSQRGPPNRGQRQHDLARAGARAGEGAPDEHAGRPPASARRSAAGRLRDSV